MRSKSKEVLAPMPAGGVPAAINGVFASRGAAESD